LILYKRDKNGGKTRATQHPLYDILHSRANQDTDAFHWRELGQSQLLLWGNTFSTIERDNGKYIKALKQIVNPASVEIIRKGSKIYYKIKTGSNKTIIRPKSDIFHIAGFGHDGLYGKSLIAIAREAIGLGLAIEKFGGRYFGSGTHPSGVLELDKFLGDRREDYVKAVQKGHAGLSKSQGLMVLEGGAKYKPLTIPLEDAQFLQTKQSQKIDICGMYKVPPHKIAIHGSNSNYNNLEQENASYVDSCLMQWLVRWESAISNQLLTAAERRRGLFVEFLVEGLLRGDSAARAEFYSKMVAIGVLSPNDIRKKENFDPIEGGDQHFIPVNYWPLDKAQAQPDQETEPKRAVEHRSIPTVDARDKVAGRFLPLIKDVFQTIINKEALSVRKIINKRGTGAFYGQVEEFYNGFSEFIVGKAGPVLRTYLETIRDLAIDEVGKDSNPEEIEKFVNEYIAGVSERHIYKSKGQILKLDQENGDIEARMDTWHEDRAGQDAEDEKTRGSNAIYQAVVFAAGLSTVWRIRGAETCDYCKMLNGKRVVRGQHYLPAGGSLQPEGKEPMKVKGMRCHPPLHNGCDCVLSIG
jgi:HK97 family phage portal protein